MKITKVPTSLTKKVQLHRHELEKHQRCHRKQAFPGKVSGSVTFFNWFISINFWPPSSIMAARSTRSMTDNHITHIVSVCADPIPAEAPESGICHMRISVEDVDYADLLIRLPAACRFIDQAIRSGGVVFVHCVQGISRSATVVAAYCRFYFYFILFFQSTTLIIYTHAVMWSRRIRTTQALDMVRNGKRGCLISF